MDVRRLDPRHRKAALTGVATAVARFTSLATALVTIPQALRYLGPTLFGVWATITTLTALLAFADLGIGNGLVNAIASTKGGEDQVRAQEYSSSAFYSLSALGAAALGIFVALWPFIQWHSAFGLDNGAEARSAAAAALVFAIGFALGLPSGLASRVHSGLQTGYVPALWTAAGNLAGLAAVLGAIHGRAGLPTMVAALVFPPLLAQVGAWVWLVRIAPWAAPRTEAISRRAVRQLLRDGGLFFALQLSAAAIFASDNIVTAQILGAHRVVDLAVPARLFSVVAILVGLAMGPLWPAYGDALARGDSNWIRNTFRISSRLVLAISLILSVPLALLAPTLISLWTPGAVVPSTWLLAWLAVGVLVTSMAAAQSSFLNGLGQLRLQAIVGIATAILAILLKIALARTSGVTGVAAGTAIALLVGTLVPLSLVSRAVLAKMNTRVSL